MGSNKILNIGEKYAKSNGIRKRMSQEKIERELAELRVQLNHIT
jgi:hypothetical protein